MISKPNEPRQPSERYLERKHEADGELAEERDRDKAAQENAREQERADDYNHKPRVWCK